jgi:HAE1 family hydrophobic/amphiphilic exporter-1
MTLNMLTLMALSLAIGLLIDDAIVVRGKHRQAPRAGQDHFTAAREGTAEIGSGRARDVDVESSPSFYRSRS